MSKRHEKLGIKQTIQRHWMDKVLRMLLSGLSSDEIRNDLDRFLATQKQSGGIGHRGPKTYGMAIGILSSWFSPTEELKMFRDDLLDLSRKVSEEKWLPLHWAIISATYPFWFNVAKQVGRLLTLQDLITQAQVFNRLKEQYGDRETVARNARYSVRSFVAWGVIRDTDSKGCYKNAGKKIQLDRDYALLLVESALLAIPEGKGTLSSLLNHPAFFPFEFPALNADYVYHHSDRIEVIRHSLNEDLLKLKE